MTKVLFIILFNSASLLLCSKAAKKGWPLRCRTVWETGGYLPNEITEMMKKNIINEPGKIPLNPNQFNLLRYISEGKTSKEIAGLLNLSENTVNSYRQDLLKSSHTQNTDELIAFAYRTGLLH